MSNRRSNTQVEKIEAGNLSYEIQNTSWRPRLAELGSRWVPNTPENTAAFLAQVNEAWGLAYICIWNMHGRKGIHANYTDDERCEAAVHMRKGLMGYDPARQELVKFVEQKAILLLKGAWSRGIDVEYDAPREAIPQQDLEQELRELQQCADGSEEWTRNVSDILYARFATRVNNKFLHKSQRKEVASQLRERLCSYSPEQQSLKDFVDQWQEEVLGGNTKSPDKKGLIAASLDKPVGEDGETSQIDLYSAPEESLEARSAKKLTAWDILTSAAVTLNFQQALDRNILKNSEEHRHNRICYTEKVLFLARNSTLPPTGMQDVFRALLKSYLDHFAVMPEDGSAVDLRTVPFRTMEQIEDPDSAPATWKTPLEWSGANDFLPAKVPISYLKHRFSIKADDNYVKRFRIRFYKELKNQAAKHYTAEDIKEILSLS